MPETVKQFMSNDNKCLDYTDTNDPDVNVFQKRSLIL